MHRRAALACMALALLLGCRSQPASEPEGREAWIEFGIVALDGSGGDVASDSYAHWDAGGRWSVPEESIWRLERPLLRCRVESATPDVDQVGFPALRIRLQPDDAEVFRVFTRSAIGRQLAVLVEGRVVTAPVVQEPLVGTFVLQSRFSDEDVEQLRSLLEPAS